MAEHIDTPHISGYRISKISEKTGADPKTIRRYLAQEDFSPLPPAIVQKPSKFHPFKPIIDLSGKLQPCSTLHKEKPFNTGAGTGLGSGIGPDGLWESSFYETGKLCRKK